MTEPGIQPSRLKCATCSYDLTGTAIGGRCPECGTSVWDSIDALMPKDAALLPANTAATLCLVVGSLSFCIPFVGVLAIVLGIFARREIKHGRYRPSARVSADIGLLLGCVSTIFTVVVLIANNT